MKTIKSIPALQLTLNQARKNKKTIDFVPTMGALHSGHLSLIRRAKKKNAFVVVSIFINPLQFSPSEDYSGYPRSLKKDLELCRRNHVDLVYLPSSSILKSKKLEKINVGNLSKNLCGKFRPRHFSGVATIVLLFFKLVRPDYAYFGLKDYQQYRIIVDLVKRKVDWSLRIVSVPTMRHRNGLAMSSRNEYLSREERVVATNLYKILKQIRSKVKKRPGGVSKIIKEAKKKLSLLKGVRVQYLECVKTSNLTSVRSINSDEKYLVAGAIFLGKARLIDNVLI